VAGSDTTNKDDGHLVFRTSPSQGSIAERLRIKSDGNITITGKVGIGNRTSSPDENLHVHTSSGQANIHVEGATDGQIILRSHGGDSVIHFGDASATSVGKILYDHGTDSLQFTTNSSERLRIDSSGRIQMGSASNNLGAAKFNIVTGGEDGISLGRNQGAGVSNGDVLGTLAFQTAVGGQTTNSAEASIKGIAAEASTGTTAATDLAFFTKASGTGPGSSPTERLRIKSDGSTFLQTSNVNINRGTTGAGYPLTVRGPSDGDTIRIERANSYQWMIGQDTNGGNSNLYFKSNTTKEIVFPSTGGIAFNGEYAAANTLNDYEYGTWNATVQWNGGNTTGSYAHTTAVSGTYVKVGHVVHGWITIYPYNYNSGSDCVILGITLPTSANQQGAVAFAPYSGQGNYGAWLSVSTYPRTYASIDTGNNRIQVLVTGNGQGAGFWGHKSGTVAANAQITVTYYDT